MCTVGDWSYDARNEPGYVTKWFILNERLRVAKDEVKRLEDELNGMLITPLNIRCSYCLTMLETEADFAKHFTIKDTRFLNLGECPHDPTKH